MSKKHSISRKKWWYSLTEEERKEVNQRRSEAMRKRWQSLTPLEREILKQSMRVKKGKPR